MTRDEFEARVLEMWMKTRIAMTRAHLQYWTGAGRKELNKKLDELTGEGVLECDVDDDGEMVWKVPGAARRADGATSFADHERRESLAGAATGRGGRERGDDGLSSALAISRLAGELKRGGGQALVAGEQKKSLAAGAALGLLGPFGWLYSGSFKETLPAALVFYLMWTVLPTVLFVPLLSVLLPLSVVVGGVYTWQYNKTGERTTLLLDDGAKKKPKKR